MTRFIIATFFFTLSTFGTSAQEVELLLEHLYFEGEIEKELLENSWVGLIELDGTFTLKKCNIQIESAQHPMVDYEGEQTGLKVTSEPSGTICLISGIEVQNQINSIKLMNEYYPDDSENFLFSTLNYEITASGTIANISGSPISDYKLTLTCGSQSQILAESEFFDDAMFNIVWSGDLDSDGKLDLLIDLSYKYSFGLFSLFLSSAAEEGELVKLVSQHKVYYD